MSAGATLSWINTPLDSRKGHDFSSLSFRCRNHFGAIQPYWLATDQEVSLSKVRVAADYSDSLPDSPKLSSQGYHPLEEVKGRAKKKDYSLTDAETTRTLLEANNKALVVFPGPVHREPHGQTAWSEFRYVIDDYGDIFFELNENENLLRNHDAKNFVTVLVGMDSPIFGDEDMRNSKSYDNTDAEDTMDMLVADDDYKTDTEVTDILIQWGMPDTLRWIHPIYFAKCLTKAVHANYDERMDWPSNSLSIVGYLRPAFIEEESYLRSLFYCNGHGDEDLSDWRDDDSSRLNINGEETTVSRIYKLDIITIKLFSLFGNQTMVDLQDFQEAEPDLLASSASAIIERINEFGTECTAGLRSLCRKRKGLTVEGARLLSVDSLGMDVRVFSGVEAQTLRFSFNARALSESAAERKIKRMLFPRYHRKNPRAPSDGLRDS